MEYIEFRSKLFETVCAQTREGEEVTLRTIPKNNGVFLDGITIHTPGKNVCPTIYVEEMMERYDSGESLISITSEILKTSRECSIHAANIEEEYRDYTNFRSRICYRLVNRQKNRALLNELPHHKVLDLAMIYYYYTDAAEGVRGTVLVRNEDLKRWNIHPETLHKDAVRNTPVIEPATPCILTQMHLGGELLLYTNERKMYGASVMLYDNIFEEAAAYYEADLFILPSSVHEVLALPDNRMIGIEDLRNMVSEINATVVAKTEVLSDLVYRYSLERKEIYLP